MVRRQLSGRRVLITGASSGIGRAIALELARHGARLLVTARRADRLAALAEEVRQAGGTCDVLPGDVTDPAHRAALISAAEERLGGLDILINNAGVGAVGRFSVAGPDRLRQVMEVNFFAAAELIRLAVPLLRRGTRPMVVNVASILGHRGAPRVSEYSASKFALRGFSEAIRAELFHEGIGVLVVSPGTTESEFYGSVLEQRGETPWPVQPKVPAERVARDVCRAIERDRHEIVPNTRGRLLVWLNRLAPRLVDRAMQRWG